MPTPRFSGKGEYEIVVGGHLDEQSSYWFEELTMSTGFGEDGTPITTLVGRFVDQAAVEMDPAKQKKLYAEAQMQLLRDLPSLSVRLFTFPFARQPYVDLGYEPKGVMIYYYHITDKTRILKH